MKRLSTGLLAALVAVGIGTTSVSASNSAQAHGNIGPNAPTQIAQAPAGAPPADFGTPPSGEVPILFNDRHVYSKPDRLKANRVLAALVRGNTILIPLRSMFEQMGATVSYDPASKTVDVSKPGSDVKVTVGKPEVVINGESRPLDVPPEIYKGAVVVPVRVISEGMGAYVQWVPDRRIVVVRYVSPPTPPPPPPATPTPAPVVTPKPVPPPTPSPTPTPVARNPYEHYIVGDYIFSPKVYNEFSPGNKGVGGSYHLAGVVEFPAFGLPWMLEGDYRSWSYNHNSGIPPNAFLVGDGNPCPHSSFTAAQTPAAGDQGCVTVIGAYGQTAVPSFTARDTDFDGRLGLKIAEPRIYIGVGYLHREENYGYPKQNGFGFGAEKLPDLDQPLSVYGSIWYYPSISGNFTFPAGSTPPGLAPGSVDKFQQRFLKYQIGGTLNLGNSGLFLDAGFLGDSIKGKNLSPSDASHAGGFIGLGIKF
ncbi:MAG: copper amine oxidase N-terminal domain-containing protein [Candidatus Eremiobacteraeota bacterium]|nr:copper amine oxidase N-terminal domain-containing protein [Candidatus Eremiobacteraeota bacterium]